MIKGATYLASTFTKGLVKLLVRGHFWPIKTQKSVEQTPEQGDAPVELSDRTCSAAEQSRRDFVTTTITLPAAVAAGGMGLGATDADAFYNMMLFMAGDRKPDTFGLWSFGSNAYGQLGLGARSCSKKPRYILTNLC